MSSDHKLFKVKKRHFSLFFVLFLLQNISAQKGWEAGGWVGASNYFGDLNTTYSLKRAGLAAGVITRFNFNDRLCMKISANYGSISADDKNSENIFEQRRNLNFKSVLIDGAAQFEFNFLPYNYFDRSQWFSPYLFAGFNVFNFNPKAQLDGKWYNLRTLGTEGQFKGEEYYTTQMGLVYGGGLKIAISETWAINLELSARKLFSDYLDDVSKTYPNMNDLKKSRSIIAVQLSDPSVPDSEGRKMGQFGRQRGNKKDNDMYTFLSLGLVYYFGDLKCPIVNNR
jgi:opacity protein-like surface antigen